MALLWKHCRSRRQLSADRQSAAFSLWYLRSPNFSYKYRTLSCLRTLRKRFRLYRLGKSVRTSWQHFNLYWKNEKMERTSVQLVWHVQSFTFGAEVYFKCWQRKFSRLSYSSQRGRQAVYSWENGIYLCVQENWKIVWRNWSFRYLQQKHRQVSHRRSCWRKRKRNCFGRQRLRHAHEWSPHAKLYCACEAWSTEKALGKAFKTSCKKGWPHRSCLMDGNGVWVFHAGSVSAYRQRFAYVRGASLCVLLSKTAVCADW